MRDLIEIKAVVESTYNKINLSDKTRERRFCDARQIYSYISRKCTPHSFAVIGSYIKRDHATIVYSTKRSEDYMLTDKNFRDNVRHRLLLAINILDIDTSTYKDRVDIFWSNLTKEQQEEIYNQINDMYASNTGLKKEIHYVN